MVKLIRRIHPDLPACHLPVSLLQKRLYTSEAATRAVLIDPILQALGWDTANTYMVEVEKSFEQTRVDYALYDRNSNVRIVVEAKALGSNLNDRSIMKSIISYAYTYGIQDIFLTDGLIWEYITNFQPGNIDSKVINFSQDDPVDCAAYLVQRLDAAKFWPEEPTIDALTQRVMQLENLLASLQVEVSQFKGQAPPTKNQSKTGLPSNSADNRGVNIALPPDSSFIDLDVLPNVAETAPSFLRLPDSSVVKVSNWMNVLRECSKFALSHNENIPIPLPDYAGRKILLLDTRKPAPGSFVEEQYNGATIYIYVKYDANYAVKNALHILKQVPPLIQKVKAAVVYSKK